MPLKDFPANKGDFKEILRPKKQSEKPFIIPSTIVFLLLQATVDIYDARDEWVKTGLIIPEMSDMEAIALQLALYVFSGFEEKYSPKFTLSFLDNYCIDTIKENFMFYYIAYANHFGVEYSASDFDNFHQFDVMMSIADLAKEKHRFNINITAKHNPFREPFRTVWIENLS